MEDIVSVTGDEVATIIQIWDVKGLNQGKKKWRRRKLYFEDNEYNLEIVAKLKHWKNKTEKIKDDHNGYGSFPRSPCS